MGDKIDAGALAGISIDALRKRLVTKMLASDEDALPFDDYGPETQQRYLRMADAVIEAIQRGEYRELPSLNDSRNSAPQETRGDEPVAWRYRFEPDLKWHATDAENYVPKKSVHPQLEVQPLYAASQQSPRLKDK